MHLRYKHNYYKPTTTISVVIHFCCCWKLKRLVLGSAGKRNDGGEQQLGVGLALATGEASIPPDDVHSAISYEEQRVQSREQRVASATDDTELQSDEEQLLVRCVPRYEPLH